MFDCTQHTIVARVQLSKHGEHLDRYSDILDPDELARANQISSATRQQQFIIAHAALRSGLAAVLHTSPTDIEYVYTENGKPYLHPEMNTSVQFNLSHSRDYALVAIHPDRAIGIDLQFHKTTIDFNQFAQRFFHQAEIDYLSSPQSNSDLAHLRREFYRIWCRKEALVKAHGGNLYSSLKTTDVSSAEKIHLLQQDRYIIYDLPSIPDYSGALALPPGDLPIHFYEWGVKQEWVKLDIGPEV